MKKLFAIGMGIIFCLCLAGTSQLYAEEIDVIEEETTVTEVPEWKTPPPPPPMPS